MSVHHLRAAAAVAVLALSAAGYADDSEAANPDSKALLEYVKKLESRVNQLEQEKQWPLDQVRATSGSALESAVSSINLSGYMEFQYGYNFRHGGEGSFRGDTLAYNQLAGSSNDDNGFSMQNVQLLADKPLTTVNSTGFRIRAQFGDVAIYDNRDPNFNSGGTAFDVREAFMSWRAGMGSMLDHMDVTVGKMDTPLGFETPDNNVNWLVTRSFESDLVNPVTHTGLRAAAAWGEKCKTSLYIVNGWDNVRDAGDGKTAILSQDVGLDPMNSVITINFSYGNEGSIHTGPGGSPDGDKTMFGEVKWRGDLNEENKIGAEAFWCRFDNGAFDTDGSVMTRDTAGGSLYFRHQMSKAFWLAARGEYYVDDRIGADGTSLRLIGASIAAGYEVGSGLMLTVEYRHDHAITGDPFFGNSADNPNDDQDRITASAVYSF